MTQILGVDPGLGITGYGLVSSADGRLVWEASGRIQTGDGDLAKRLKRIHDGLLEIMTEHRPDEVAIEDVFMARSFTAALKLGQARGAAILSAVNLGLPVFAYMPRRVKKAVTGVGAASKGQVQHMVRVLLNMRIVPGTDAADALAVAICHAHYRGTSA